MLSLRFSQSVKMQCPLVVVILIPAEDTDSMTGQSEEITKRVQDLTVRFGAEAMRSLLRYYELLQRLADGELDEAGTRETYVRFMRDEAERYFHSAAMASTSYYNTLLELASIYRPPFFENASKQREWQAPSPSAARDRRTVVELRGSVGDEAVNAFQVRNSSGDSEEVAFVVSEFCGPPGSVLFRPPFRLQPPRFVLGPFESQLVSVRLPLLADLFATNQHYSATLTVQKRDAFDLAIEVIVAAPPDSRGPSTRAPSGGAQ
jgi:hypothetical protein